MITVFHENCLNLLVTKVRNAPDTDTKFAGYLSFLCSLAKSLIKSYRLGHFLVKRSAIKKH